MPHHEHPRPLRRWFTTVLLVAVTALAATGVSAPAAGTDRRPGVQDPQLQAALDAVVAAGATGVSLRLDDGERTVRAAAGHARAASAASLRPEARLRVGSLTKTFVATAVLQLTGDGVLRLDDTVERWLPGLLPGGDGITLRQLLDHTSGVFNYTDDEVWITALLADPLREYTARELVAVAASHPPYFPPGAGHRYSNTNYVLLGMVLERASGRPLDALLRQRIVEPLRLRDTYLPTREVTLHGYHARGYLPPVPSGIPGADPGQHVDVTRISPTIFRGAGSLVSNPDDLRTFFGALLSGQLLRPAELAEMKTLVTSAPGFGYGLGLYSIETPCGPVWGHDGYVPGYLTVAWNDESGRRGFALGMPTAPDDAIGSALTDVLVAAACRVAGEPAPATAAGARRGAPAPLPLVDRPATWAR